MENECTRNEHMVGWNYMMVGVMIGESGLMLIILLNISVMQILYLGN